MIKNVKEFLDRVIKKPLLTVALFFTVAIISFASTTLYKRFSATITQSTAIERNFALSTIKEVLELSKAMNGFYKVQPKNYFFFTNYNQTKIIKYKNKFFEISTNLEKLSNAYYGTDLISKTRKVSDFYISCCYDKIDILNQLESADIIWRANRYITPYQAERLCDATLKFQKKIDSFKNEVVQTIPFAFSQWKHVFSLDDYRNIGLYIEKNFPEVLKKYSKQKDKTGKPMMSAAEWIVIEILQQTISKMKENEKPEGYNV